MIRKIIISIFLYSLVLLAFPKPATAQADDEDVSGIWTTFSLEKPISKKVTIGLDEEVRLRDFGSELNLVYTNLGISYRPVKRIKLGLTYRWTEKYMNYNEAGWFSTRHRLMGDVSYRHKWNSLILAYRTMVQSEFKNYHSSKNGKVPEWFWRNKLELKYNLDNFIPYIGTEIRYQIHDPRNPYADMGFHRIRAFAGCDYKINKRNTVGLYFLGQREFGVINPESQYIMGLEYTFELKD